jgi:hypothetical protein
VWKMSSSGDPLAGGRPAGVQLGWTSTDAAGMPVFPGLVTYYETVVKKRIDHALRFTIVKSGMAYLTPPATHYASNDAAPSRPPMGMRIRLAAGYNCTSGLASSEARVICVALQTYGAFVADNGGDCAISGTADPRWNDAALGELRKLPLSAFEAVETGATLCTDPGCTALGGGRAGAGSYF